MGLLTVLQYAISAFVFVGARGARDCRLLGIPYGARMDVERIAGIGLPLVLALLWSIMGSPKASIRLGEPYYFLFQLAMFGLPVVFLALLGRTGGAIGYGAVALLNLILMYVWKP